jgi:glucose/arabinose dehydrogenase
MCPRLVLAVLAVGFALIASACGGGGASGRGASERETAATVPAVGSAPKTADGTPALRRIGEFDHPVYVAGAPAHPRLLFVVEQAGRIMVVDGGHRLSRPFLDIRDQVGYDRGERGLLSVAFPLDYATSDRFYVYYVDKGGSIQIDEYRRGSAARADPASRRGVITIPHPVNANHNGGQMQFLGDDLYFGTGDGGAAGDPPNNAQNVDSLLGKLLRIDPRPAGGDPYSVPPTNPFVGAPGRDEIYSYGLRNPFRFSFDLATDARRPRLAIGDVGQNRFEEIDYTTVAAARGANFGWDAFEGDAPYDDEDSGTPDPGGTTKPILAYPHSRGGSCSVIGGYVITDPTLPSLRGRYIYADYCEGELRTLTPHLHRATADHKLGLAVPSPTSFGEDDAHHIYVTSEDGPVYRLVEK